MKIKHFSVIVLAILLGIFIGLTINIQKKSSTIKNLKNKNQEYKLKLDKLESVINSMSTEKTEYNLYEKLLYNRTGIDFKPKQKELEKLHLEFRNKLLYLPERLPVRKLIITKSYLPSQNHFGIDCAGKKGELVFAAGSGVVKKINMNDKTFGKTILIDHLNGYKSFYGHNSEISVKEGYFVEQGQQIANIGKTGKSTAPHLHFEILYNDSHINPLKILK